MAKLKVKRVSAKLAWDQRLDSQLVPAERREGAVEVRPVAGVVIGGKRPVGKKLGMMVNDDADALLVRDAQQRLLEPVGHLADTLVLADDLDLDRRRCRRRGRRGPVAEDDVDRPQTAAEVGVEGAEGVPQLVLLLGRMQKSQRWLNRSRKGKACDGPRDNA